MTPDRPEFPGAGDSRIAIVHDYMTQLGGAERVAGVLARQFPGARLLTSVHREATVPQGLVGGRGWETSFLQHFTRLPLKSMLPLLPAAVSSLDVRGSELVISSSSAFAHHVRPESGAVHVCFCHTPSRFLWEPRQYFGESRAQEIALGPLLRTLRKMDLKAASRVSAYIAVSRHVARRIESVYGRVATVVYPPVDVQRFSLASERSSRFLVVSRLVRSKRVDRVVEAANQFGLPLDVIGTGPELRRLTRLAGPTVRVLGWQPDGSVRDAMAQCTAVVIAGEEDFGLVTAEAQASGRPPVAFAAGGALEIIDDGVTGFLFSAQSPDAIGEAMIRAQSRNLQATDLRDSAERFDVPVFREQFARALDSFGWRAPASLIDARVG